MKNNKEKNNMKLETPDDTEMDPLNIFGFVKIKNLENAQQATFNIEYLEQLLKTVTTLKKAGFEKLVITLETDSPIIIGGKNIGLALSPRIDI